MSKLRTNGWPLILVFFLAAPTMGFAQDWAISGIKQLQRVDIRELGYPQVNQIPENSSAITSLLTTSNGKIYGGTTGENAYLFFFDPATNKAQHLGKLPDQKTIHHSLVEGKDGMIYIGTGGIDLFEPIEFSHEGFGENPDNRFYNKTVWQDVQKHFSQAPSGHLFRYDPKKGEKPIPIQGVFTEDLVVQFVDMNAKVEDLGVPLANNMIYSMTVSPDGNEIYGLTYPDGHFFIYDVEKEAFQDKGAIDSQIRFHGPERHWRSLPRALICDDSGNVYTSGADGILMYYHPKSGKFESTGQKIPGDTYPIHRADTYAVVECFARDAAGLIYGGSSDGFLFSFDSAENVLRNLGKVRSERRLRALTIGHDGRLFLVAGERPETSGSPCQFYTYDPTQGSFTTLGLLIADRSPHYYWRGYQFDSITTGVDGTIYLGESERRSHLFFYIP
jgi:hypothetical protein